MSEPIIHVRTTTTGDTFAQLEIRKRLKAKFEEARRQIDGEQQALLEWGMIYMPHHFTRKFSRFHVTLANKYDAASERRGQKLCIIAPRGNAKSTITLVKIVKSVCEASEKYILLVMDTLDQTAGQIDAVAHELEFNEKLRASYPIACRRGKVWNKTRLETANNVCIEGVGTGQKVRGRKFHQYRPSLVIVDDPDNDDDVRSVTIRTAHIDWFNKALLEVGDTETNYFVIGTMIHRECIVAECEKRPDFQTIKFASIVKWPIDMEKWNLFEKIFWSDNTPCKDGTRDNGGKGKYDGETMGMRHARVFYEKNTEAMEEGADVLWPEKESLYQLMVRRASSGHPAFESEKQNNPRDPSKCSFREDWFDDIMYEPEQLSTLMANPKQQRVTISYIDPSKGKETVRGDDSAIVTFHYFGGNCVYVEALLKKIPLTELTDALMTWNRHVGTQFLGVEVTGFQELIAEDLETKIKETNEFGVTIVPMDTQGVNKLVRVDRLSIWLQRKFFKFRTGCPYCAKIIQQLKDHPFNDHDDGGDALEGCTRLLMMTVDAGTMQTTADAVVPLYVS